MIAGLPLPSFGIVMVFFILSLLLMIFSFSFFMLIVLLISNMVLYVVLVRFAADPNIINVQKVFPKLISNKKTNDFHYDEEHKPRGLQSNNTD